MEIKRLIEYDKIIQFLGAIGRDSIHESNILSDKCRHCIIYDIDVSFKRNFLYSFFKKQEAVF